MVPHCAKAMNYTLIRSKRQTVSIQLKPDGSVTVRAPLWMSSRAIEEFVQSKSGWIEKHLPSSPICEKLTDTELEELTKQAKSHIPQRVAFFAGQMGISYGSISIRHQKTRWGSCSGKGNLNFNCLLMLCPSEVIDSVVVHELAHRKEMNHSYQFYAIVYRFFPEYDKWHGWLKKDGSGLIARLP